MRVTTYGPGGFDPKKPNSNVIDVRDVADPILDTQPTTDEKIDALTAAIKASASIADLKVRIIADPTLDPVRVVPLKG